MINKYIIHITYHKNQTDFMVNIHPTLHLDLCLSKSICHCLWIATVMMGT